MRILRTRTVLKMDSPKHEALVSVSFAKASQKWALKRGDRIPEFRVQTENRTLHSVKLRGTYKYTNFVFWI